MAKVRNDAYSSSISPSHQKVQMVEDFDPNDRLVTVNISFQHPSGRTVEYSFECKGIVASMIRPKSPLLNGNYDSSVLPIVVGLSNSYELSIACCSINDILQDAYQDMEQAQGGI